MATAIRIYPIRLAVCLWLCFLAAGCGSGGGTVELFDSLSGLTIVTEREPVAYARTLGQFSRSARDYVYLGPVEINERGRREYFLWVGIASTIDRDYLAAESVMPGLLYLNLAGEPVEFELRDWQERVSQYPGNAIYDPAVAPTRVLAGRVTLDQLALIAREQPQSIRVATRDQPTTEYFVWSEESRWSTFASFAGQR